MSMTLRRVVRRVGGTGFPPHEQGIKEGALPFFKVGDFTLPGNEVVMKSCNNWISTITASKLRASPVPENTLLFPKIGAALLGNARRMTHKTSVFDNNILGLVPRDIDPRYLYYLMSSLDLAIYANPGPVPSLDESAFMDVRVPISRAASQRAIADFLDAETARIDALIIKKCRLIDLVAEREAGIVEQSVRALADGIGEVRLKMAVDSITVGIVITPSAWYTEGDGIPALRGVNVRSGRINPADMIKLSTEGHKLHRKSELRTGDVVVVRTGQAGSAVVVPSEFNGANCIDLLIVRPGSLNSHYLSYVLNSDWTRKHIDRHSVGAIQAHFNVGSLAELPIPIPPLGGQVEFVAKMNRLVRQQHDARKRMEAQVALLREHRQALITAAVTGEMEVPGVAR